MKDYPSIDKIITDTDIFSVEERTELIRLLITQQRQHYEGRRCDYDRDMCTLIDLERGLIVGSGICPECHGWLGRVTDDSE